MRLTEFLNASASTRTKFASEIGVTRIALHRYERGERFPRPEILERITAATEGKVTANDFMAAREAAQ